MRKRIVVVVVLAILMAASAYAQTTDLFSLAQIGTPQDVQAAIDKGADVDAVSSRATPRHAGWTALMYAAASNTDPEVITALVKAGADVNFVNFYRATALIEAAAYNRNPKVIIALLMAGADVNVKGPETWTPLMWAASDNQNPEVITALLKGGADVNARSETGWSPLLLAARDSENPEVITTLLKAGADAKAKDNLIGSTALDYAQGNARLKGTDAVKQLEDASK